MPDAPPAAGEAVLIISADVSFLVVIRHFVQVAGSQLGVTAAALEEVVHAVDELSANSILHGYQGAPGRLEIRCRVEGEALVITLRDQAPAFDPTSQPDPDLAAPLEARGVGGLGIYLSRTMMDEMRYRRLPAGENELTLVKRAARNR